jgi:hypothetical protein
VARKTFLPAASRVQLEKARAKANQQSGPEVEYVHTDPNVPLPPNMVVRGPNTQVPINRPGSISAGPSAGARLQTFENLSARNHQLARELNEMKTKATALQKTKATLTTRNNQLESIVRGLTEQTNQLHRSTAELSRVIVEQDDRLGVSDILIFQLKAKIEELTSLDASAADVSNSIFNAIGNVINNVTRDTTIERTMDRTMGDHTMDESAIAHVNSPTAFDCDDDQFGGSPQPSSPLRSPKFNHKTSPTAEYRQYHKRLTRQSSASARRSVGGESSVASTATNVSPNSASGSPYNNAGEIKSPPYPPSESLHRPVEILSPLFLPPPSLSSPSKPSSNSPELKILSPPMPPPNDSRRGRRYDSAPSSPKLASSQLKKPAQRVSRQRSPRANSASSDDDATEEEKVCERVNRMLDDDDHFEQVEKENLKSPPGFSPQPVARPKIMSPADSPPVEVNKSGRTRRKSIGRVSYKEPSVSAKLRKGDVFFPLATYENYNNGGVEDSLAFVGMGVQDTAIDEKRGRKGKGDSLTFVGMADLKKDRKVKNKR